LGLVFSSRWGKDWASFRGSERVLAKIWGRAALASSWYTFLKVSRPSNSWLVMLFLLLNAAWQLIEAVVASRDRIGEWGREISMVVLCNSIRQLDLYYRRGSVVHYTWNTSQVWGAVQEVEYCLSLSSWVSATLEWWVPKEKRREMGILCDCVAFLGIGRSWSWLAERIDKTGVKLIEKWAKNVLCVGEWKM